MGERHHHGRGTEQAGSSEAGRRAVLVLSNALFSFLVGWWRLACIV